MGCDREPAQPVSFEVHIIHEQPALGWAPMTIDWMEQTYFVYDKPLLTNADVASADWCIRRKQPVLEVSLNDSGQHALARYTQHNLKSRLGVLIDGKLVAAMFVEQPMYDHVIQVDGNFTRQQVKSIVHRLLENNEDTEIRK